MSCALTSDYAQASCGDLFGGVPVIHIIEHANISAVTVTAGIITGITKVTASKFRLYTLKQGTADGKEVKTVNRMNNTSHVKQTVTYTQQGLSAALRTELELLCKNLVTIVVQDENGTGWLYGKDKGMMVATADATTGKLLADANGYIVNLDAEEKYFAYPLDAATMLTLETVGA